MTIDEARRHPAAFEVNGFAWVDISWQLAHRTDPDDPPVLSGDGAGLDDAEPRQDRRQGGDAGVDPEVIHQTCPSPSWKSRKNDSALPRSAASGLSSA